MIKIENISFTYPNQTKGSLKDINLTINKGECVLFCGNSGCGKTTITHLINGLIPNFYAGRLNGKVTIDGMDTLNTPLYEISAHVGSVFQNPRTQFFNVDTDSEIAFGIENAALPYDALEARVAQTTTALGLNHLRGRNIFELSGGEKQKIAFASVYAMNPDVFLLDEPSSNLDADSISELQKLLLYIKQQGKTILIAEHRLSYLIPIIDKIIYLSDGRISRIFASPEFVSLTEQERKSMGLRAINPCNVHPQFKVIPKKMPLLVLENISLNYKKQSILQNISLKASDGEIIAIIGHNGTGKTTFCRALCGLHKQCSGEFLWNDVRQTPKMRKKLSYMVMQDVNYELFADSVQSECSLGICHPDSALIEDILKKLALFPYREQHPNTLSGGQKQRLAIAVSMICQKELLVFDEPTSGLDYDSMNQAADLIQQLSDMKKMVFIVTHDYEFVCRTCTRVLHFENGSISNDLEILPSTINQIRSILVSTTAH